MTVETFNQTLLRMGGEDLQSGVKSWFDALALPLPTERDGFFHTTDEGILIPITYYAVTARITFQQKITGQHCGHTLDPLGSRKISLTDVRLNPGLRLKVTSIDQAKMAAIWFEEEYLPYDLRGANAGYMPLATKTEQFKNGIPLYHDPNVIIPCDEHAEDFRLNTMAAGAQLPSHAAQAAQDLIWGSLQRSYSQCLAGIIQPADFWNQCAEAKRGGTLVSAWADKSYNLMDTGHSLVKDAAREYDEILRPHLFHRDIA